MRKIALAIVSVVLAVCMAVGLVACGEGRGKVTITLSETTLTMTVGDTETLEATTSDDSNVTWTSSDESVAEVNSRGRVTAMGAGEATITATSGEATATCKVTVKAKPVITISGLQETATVERGQTITLTATASDSSAIEWASSDTDIATVNDEGVVTGVFPGETTIVAFTESGGRAECELTVTYNSAAEGWYAIQFSEQNKSAQGVYTYWADQPSWNGSDVQVSNIEYLGDADDSMAGEVTFTYQVNSGAFWAGMQLTYRDNEITEAGKAYNLTFDLESDAAGTITVNGNLVDIEEGVNHIDVNFVCDDDGTIYPDGDYTNVSSALYICMGYEDNGEDIVLEGATITISKLQWTEIQTSQLAAPSVALDGTAITVTDGTNEADKVGGYQVGFFTEADSDQPLYAMTLTGTTGTIDDTTYVDDEYTLKVRALAADATVTNSDWSAQGVAYTVSHGAVSYEMTNTEQSNITNDKWIFWSEFDSITATYSEANGVDSSISDAGGNWYSCQYFYRASGMLSDRNYTVTMTLTATLDGKITVNGMQVTLVANEPKQVTLTLAGGTDISIQLGVYGVGPAFGQVAVDFDITNFAFTPIAGATQLQAPTFTLSDQNVITITDPNGGTGVGSFQLGFFQDDELVEEITVANGDTLDLSAVPNGEYTVRLRALATDLTYLDSDWSESSAEVTVANAATTIPNGIETDTFDKSWKEWHSQEQSWAQTVVTLQNATYTEDENSIAGIVNLEFTTSGGGQSHAMQLFYKDSEVESGLYELTMKINSSAAGSITINGNAVALIEGDNDVSVFINHTQGNTLIAIQVGSAAGPLPGKFIISDIQLAAATATALQAPTFTLSDQNVITITDPNEEGVGSFTLGFFQNDELQSEVTVANGDTLDLSAIPNGEYVVKLRAVAANVGFTNSDWSTSTANVTVANESTVVNWYEEGKVPDKTWGYWSASVGWNAGTSITVSEAEYLEDETSMYGSMHIVFVNNKNDGGTNGQPWALQVYYKDSSVATGTYTLTMKIESDITGTIILNDQEVDIVAGETTNVSITINHTQGNTLIKFQMGNTETGALDRGDITISAIQLTAAEVQA